MSTYEKFVSRHGTKLGLVLDGGQKGNPGSRVPANRLVETLKAKKSSDKRLQNTHPAMEAFAVWGPFASIFLYQ